MCVSFRFCLKQIFLCLFLVSSKRVSILFVAIIQIDIYSYIFLWRIRSQYLKRAFKKDPLALVVVCVKSTFWIARDIQFISFCVLALIQKHTHTHTLNHCKSSPSSYIVMLSAEPATTPMFSQCVVHDFSKQLRTNERPNEMRKKRRKTNKRSRNNGHEEDVVVHSSQRYGSLGVQMFSRHFF